MRKFIKLPFQVTGIIVALLWLFQTPLWAKIYKWKDDQGKLHFTDDRAKIPLKYREKVQKFKGVTEPKEEEPEEEPKEEPSAEVKPPPEKKPKQAGPPPLTEEERAAMTAVYQPLIMLWNKHLGLILRGDPDEKNLKRYVGVAQLSATRKKAIKKTIGDIEHPLLVEIKSFMKKSGRKDARLREDTPGLMTQVKFYKKRLLKEIPMENKFIKKLHEQLQLKAPPPLITLEEGLKRAAEKRVQRNKSER